MLFELEIDRAAGKVTIRRMYRERLTAQQKYKLWLATIGGATLAALVYMVGFFALVVAAVVLVLYGIGKIME